MPCNKRIDRKYTPQKTKDVPIKLKIVLKNDVSILHQCLTLTEEELVAQPIDDWLSKGIIKPCYSKYASLMVLIKKKDRSMCELSKNLP